MEFRPLVTRSDFEKMTPPRKRLSPARDIGPIFAKGRESEKINNHNYGYLEHLYKQR